ncbi:hypothetical protein IU450_33690 [Nocardia abscessus]|uniref:hypothetical protein n=1 Tax=Nocardia abscessus TaxID=120957 RepID=UPI001893C4FF|nr:hypothetical protein [Nocardia abscessus]MBF6340811.1 hypothetical protein [Nocardia abscessus]
MQRYWGPVSCCTGARLVISNLPLLVAVDLTEAVVASALVKILNRTQISIPIVISGILVAAAILLDIQGQSR